MNGVRILDFTRVLAGPWAAQQLADQGADVVKVEPPDGDETREFGPIVEGISTYFLSCNRNKRSICLDLRTEAGRDVALALADRADVVLENFRPGVLDRLGVGYEAVKARNPSVIYVAIHAFGEDGPAEWTARPGYDLVLQAMGGGMSFTGFPGSPPVRSGSPSADLLAGMQAIQAVLLGLLHRGRTGEGQKIVVSMLQSQHAALVYHATRHAVTGELEERKGNAHRGLVPYDVYPVADGWIALACGNDAIWGRLRGALNIDDVPAWRTNRGRVAARESVDRAVGGALAAMSRMEADRILAAAGVPAGTVLDVGEVRAHPAAVEVTVDHPVLGSVAVPGPAIRTATTRSAHRAPPALGADRDEVLSEIGLAPEDIARAEAAGAFGGVRRPVA